ncbi:hypothetical protein M4I21_01465 [Cellulophaga sp. 20_2_10]|uniref:hypothetical protein n=1 Tax=Cellulophaga sp. 20_2_10 TaxID=2942476 RepID=UPI00201AC9EC|nr:hypothetical protein [Cellulophaga sp. 20_2_10]MCL5244457.1 hypothetical protein [Cellulophaga sp. 20_2_10]
MKKKFLLLSTVFLILGLTKSYGGWYQCYNYEGKIGEYPITLSIQITEGYFGEEDKKEFTINGVYKYDKYNNPIKLIGSLKNNRIKLYENYNDKESAILEFEFLEKISKGYWTDLKSKKTLPLNLTYVSKLTDKSEDASFENVEILQLHSLKDYYFIGVYSKEQDANRVYMSKLKIIKKRDNSIFQMIDFNDLDYSVGNVITIIYQNIEINDLVNNKLDLWCDVGRMGGWFTLSFSNEKNKFSSNYELNIDGPN